MDKTIEKFLYEVLGNLFFFKIKIKITLLKKYC